LVSDPERSLTRRASGPEGKGRQGGIFKALKYYTLRTKVKSIEKGFPNIHLAELEEF
jgi:hypothetical protein